MSIDTSSLHFEGGNGRPQVIAWFDDFDGSQPFEALSNFYIGKPIRIREFGDRFMTGEHAFAALKAFRDGQKTEEYRDIRDARSPGEAKYLGQKCRLRQDWEAVKYDVMMAVLRAKFTLDREEGNILLTTGDALLIEGTFWDDEVWGVALGNVESPFVAPGRNWLGTMLMARRAELKAEEFFGYKSDAGTYNGRFAVNQF